MWWSFGEGISQGKIVFASMTPPHAYICLQTCRNGPEEVDERYIFQGSENPLIMSQRYTHELECFFELHDYPFDEQVK